MELPKRINWIAGFQNHQNGHFCNHCSIRSLHSMVSKLNKFPQFPKPHFICPFITFGIFHWQQLHAVHFASKVLIPPSQMEYWSLPISPFSFNKMSNVRGFPVNLKIILLNTPMWPNIYEGVCRMLKTTTTTKKDPLTMSCFATTKLFFTMFSVNDTPSIMMMTVTTSSWFIKSKRAAHRKKCCKP